MVISKSNKRLLLILLKQFNVEHTITSLVKQMSMTRVGIWKSAKKLEKEGLISLDKIGEGKTSTYRINLDWSNALLEKTLSLLLAEESLTHKRWLSNFKELEKDVYFLILFGSTATNKKEGNDIDILFTFSGKRAILNVEKKVNAVQRTLDKKIHTIGFTEAELKKELLKNNNAMVSAINEGIVLYGHEKFILFIKKVSQDFK